MLHTVSFITRASIIAPLLQYTAAWGI